MFVGEYFKRERKGRSGTGPGRRRIYIFARTRKAATIMRPTPALHVSGRTIALNQAMDGGVGWGAG
jgi:hypothetical protein